MILRLAILLVVLLAAGCGRSDDLPPFAVGFGEDLPKEIGARATEPARSLGATALRLTTRWTPGQTQLDPDEVARLDRAVAASSGLRLFLAVYGTAGSSAPRDGSLRETYCGFVRGILERYPAIRDVVIWNEPNKRLFWNPQTTGDGSSLAPAEYAALLARCYDALHEAVPEVHVLGLALSATGDDNAGSHSPGRFIQGVGEAYRASGRTEPLFDGVAFHPYTSSPGERPWSRHIGSKTIGQGDWNKLMLNLARAFDGTGQPVPGECSGSVCPLIWYLESGFQTLIDPAKASLYTGTETTSGLLGADEGGEPDTPPAADAPAPDQSTQVTDATRLAACQPHVGGMLNFLLADEPRLEGWQSGALWADLTEKPSAPAFKAAFAAATSGEVDCSALKGGRPSGDYVPPPPPAALSAAAAEGVLRVVLRWDAVDDPSGPVTYRVYRSGALLTTTSASSWTDTAVRPGTTYRYTVRALDTAGNLGEAASEVKATGGGAS